MNNKLNFNPHVVPRKLCHKWYHGVRLDPQLIGFFNSSGISNKKERISEENISKDIREYISEANPKNQVHTIPRKRLKSSKL